MNSFHPLIQKVQEWLFWLSSRHKCVCFCWVPAHVGIPGNEEADTEAKNASTARNITCKVIPHSDMRRAIKDHILHKWQELWNSSPKNLKYKKIRPTVESWSSLYQNNRKNEVVLSRLRVGHTRLTHGHILVKGNAPVCDHCQQQVTVEHILVHCQKYTAVRRRHSLGNNIDAILGNDADIEKLIRFLKDINLFYEF